MATIFKCSCFTHNRWPESWLKIPCKQIPRFLSLLSLFWFFSFSLQPFKKCIFFTKRIPLCETEKRTTCFHRQKSPMSSPGQTHTDCGTHTNNTYWDSSTLLEQYSVHVSLANNGLHHFCMACAIRAELLQLLGSFTQLLLQLCHSGKHQKDTNISSKYAYELRILTCACKHTHAHKTTTEHAYYTHSHVLMRVQTCKHTHTPACIHTQTCTHIRNIKNIKVSIYEDFFMLYTFKEGRQEKN